MRNEKYLKDAETLATIGGVLRLYMAGVPVESISVGSGLSLACIRRIVECKPAYDGLRVVRRDERTTLVSAV